MPIHTGTATATGTSTAQAAGAKLNVRQARASEIKNVIRYYGDMNVPGDVRRRRKLNLESMRRVGTPVIVKRMYTDRDVQEGLAIPSPNFDNVYKQTRHDDPLSFGVGYVSIELSEDEWYHLRTGKIVQQSSSPGNDWLRAPKYRGFGPGYLTYVIEPDVAEDVYKHTEAGVFIKTQSATAQAPWFPEMNDNDLLINVILDRSENIVDTKERFQLKMTNPVSIRGLDRRGRREYTEDGGNRYVVQQNFEMTLIPKHDILYDVDVDR
jgi:hypothetical protein